MSQRTVKSFFKTFKDEADSIYCDPNFERFKIQEWLLENKCSTLQECWEKIPADALLWMATRRNVLTKKDFQQFGLFCCNRLNHLMKDKRSLNAFHMTKKYINGETTIEKLICDMNSAFKFIEDGRPSVHVLSANTEERILQSSWHAGSLGYCTAVLVSGNLNPNLDRRYSLQIAKSAADAVFLNACANYDDYTDRVIEVGLERTRQSDWLRNCTPNFTKSTRDKKFVTISFRI